MDGITIEFLLAIKLEFIGLWSEQGLLLILKLLRTSKSFLQSVIGSGLFVRMTSNSMSNTKSNIKKKCAQQKKTIPRSDN